MSEAENRLNAPPTAAPVVAAKREPPPEAARHVRRRRFTILSFWAVAVCLGLPLWYKTTTVYRAALPLVRMTAWADGKVCSPVFPLRINVEAPSLNTAEAENLLRLTQHALDDSNDFPTHHLRLAFADTNQYAADFGHPDAEAPSTSPHLTEPVSSSVEPAALTVRLKTSDAGTASSAYFNPNTLVLDIAHTPQLVPSPSTTPSVLGTFIATQLHNIFAEERDLLRQLMSPAVTSANARNQIQDASLPLTKRSTRMAKYAPIYHLTFSLFTPTAFPSAWEIEAVLQQTLIPLLASLSPISNFTIDTQVQPYAAYSPSVRPTYSETQNAWIINREELGGFINAAEWPLNPGIGAGPTINFVLYVASAPQSPLFIEGSSSNSWIIPQWGGVVILNPSADAHGYNGSVRSGLTDSDLQPPFSIFAAQLLSLLGLPSTPTNSLPLRLSVLTRIRAANLLLSASSTLGSLARLVAALPSISIPDSVADSVSATLGHLETACSNFHDGNFKEALQNARVADQEAQKAFFERSMVGQVYFPEEHKVAVYLPLLGPMAVPLVMSAAKEILPLLRRRRRDPVS